MVDLIDRREALVLIDAIFPRDPKSDFSQGVAVGVALAKIAVEKAEPKEERMLESVCRLIAEAFDEPCNYTFGDISIDEYMLTKNETDWCENHCGTGTKDAAICWKQMFKLMLGGA